MDLNSDRIAKTCKTKGKEEREKYRANIKNGKFVTSIGAQITLVKY